MAINGLRRVTLGVPDLNATAAFYEDFGLTRSTGWSFATTDGEEQLKLAAAPRRRLLEALFTVDTLDDLAAIQRSLTRLGVQSTASGETLVCHDPGTGTRIVLRVMPRLTQEPAPASPVNGRGRIDRVNARTPGLQRSGRVRPRRLGHFVLGSTEYDASFAFFTRGLGFKVSDIVRDLGVFLRCSTDHHNVLIQRAPVPFLHHTSWQVDDVDEIGRGAMDLLADHPERHVWGMGRHYAGSNFFWYFKDPAGNFAEYHSDMDSIPEDALWTPEILEGAKGLFQWGPPPPPSFINPEDLADLMINSHQG
ncbi:VOC family protein [Streptomyces sp. B3I8]|uniref:VOC family protein n=1 Tax=Streptomyces sp. B3I8 TaxID=3042303 RepID=UPI0027872B04|nr:VOC family protein [Streptomyces sp. B3I8]MDQ0790798.1 catechol 2,3-dioxygenase-like lactoylglutathione lyase family enzyme [Streptomyces sp. B3I8]